MWSRPVYVPQLVGLAAVIVTACALLGTGTSILLDPLMNLAELPPPDADQLNPDPSAFSDPAWLLQNPIIRKMCHHPQDLQGLEGELFTDYQLEEVHVVLTPSEISPSTRSQDLVIQPPEFNCMFESYEQNNADFLSFKETADLYFASNRKKFHASPSSEVCQEGQLTPKGVVQFLTVGRNLQEAYFFRSFCNRYLPRADTLDIHSMTASAAFQSLVAFLHGFLPEKQLIKALIQKSSENFCSSLNSSVDSCHCHYLDELLPQIRRAVQQGRFIFKDDFMSIAEVEKTLNSPMRGQLSAVEQYNLLMPLVCKGQYNQYHKLTSHFMKFAEEGILLLINKTFEHFMTLSKDPVFKRFSDSYSYPFLEAMVMNMYSKRRSDKKIHLYSGDLTFLLSLLTSLGTPVEEYIPPATRLVFELYRGQAKSFYVRVLLNGKVITQELSMCGAGRTATHGMCPLVTLADFLRQKVTSLPCYR